MNTHSHAAVWLNHRGARIYGLTRHMVFKTEIDAPNTGLGHIHHHAGTPGPGHVAIDRTFLAKISAALGDTREVLLMGPADAKHALRSFLQQNRPEQATHVMGVEPIGNVSDAEIVQSARRFFAQFDRMGLLRGRPL
jgi:hypothetical protein